MGTLVETTLHSASCPPVAMPRAPGPHARVLGGPPVAWRGAEGECVPDPVTPGVVWLGGARGGSRCEGLTHQPAGPHNGGDYAVARANLALRDITLDAIEARAAQRERAAFTLQTLADAWRARRALLLRARARAAVVRQPEGRALAAVPRQGGGAAPGAGAAAQAGPDMARATRRFRVTSSSLHCAQQRLMRAARARQAAPAGGGERRPLQDARPDARGRGAVRGASRAPCCERWSSTRVAGAQRSGAPLAQDHAAPYGGGLCLLAA